VKNFERWPHSFSKQRDGDCSVTRKKEKNRYVRKSLIRWAEEDRKRFEREFRGVEKESWKDTENSFGRGTQPWWGTPRGKHNALEKY